MQIWYVRTKVQSSQVIQKMAAWFLIPTQPSLQSLTSLGQSMKEKILRVGCTHIKDVKIDLKMRMWVVVTLL